MLRARRHAGRRDGRRARARRRHGRIRPRASRVFRPQPATPAREARARCRARARSRPARGASPTSKSSTALRQQTDRANGRANGDRGSSERPSATPMNDVRALIRKARRERILVLDGAMGTMIQGHGLGGGRLPRRALRDHPHDLQGQQRHARAHPARRHPRASTRPTSRRAPTSSRPTRSTRPSIAQADYGLRVGRLRASTSRRARLAKRCAPNGRERTPDRPRFVAGALGPTNRTLSLSPDVNDPGFRTADLR